LTDSFTLRRTALMNKIAYYTTVSGAKASVEGIAAVSAGALDVAPLQSYFKGTF
jgi:carbamoyl-phosphate synthase large subunit